MMHQVYVWQSNQWNTNEMEQLPVKISFVLFLTLVPFYISTCWLDIYNNSSYLQLKCQSKEGFLEMLEKWSPTLWQDLYDEIGKIYIYPTYVLTVPLLLVWFDSLLICRLAMTLGAIYCFQWISGRYALSIFYCKMITPFLVTTFHINKSELLWWSMVQWISF